MKNSDYHETVMVREAVESLHIQKDCKYIDATLGNGGHSEEIARLGGEVLGIEADPTMLEIAVKRLGTARPAPKLVLGNFVEIDKIARENGFEKVSGILFDLGVTNLHLTSETRGFSFGNPNAELDMRLNHETQGVKGSDLLNVLREDQLRSMFEVTLESGPSKWITNRVLAQREAKPFSNVGDFLEACSGLRTGKSGLSEATLPFLALRIAVNSELDNLSVALPKAYELLEKGGRLVVISFHSGEDRIVKKFFGNKEKPIKPSEEEFFKNRRSRSAKMRILEKI